MCGPSQAVHCKSVRTFSADRRLLVDGKVVHDACVWRRILQVVCWFVEGYLPRAVLPSAKSWDEKEGEAGGSVVGVVEWWSSGWWW